MEERFELLNESIEELQLALVENALYAEISNSTALIECHFPPEDEKWAGWSDDWFFRAEPTFRKRKYEKISGNQVEEHVESVNMTNETNNKASESEDNTTKQIDETMSSNEPDLEYGANGTGFGFGSTEQVYNPYKRVKHKEIVVHLINVSLFFLLLYSYFKGKKYKRLQNQNFNCFRS